MTTFLLPDEEATLSLGASLAPHAGAGLVIYLLGDLGAGKTTFARGLLRGLGHAGRVKSPTYTLVEVYEVSRLSLYHFDFYRFQDPREWIDAGFRDMFNGQGLCLVEWPEKARGLLPPADLAIRLDWEASGRRARIEAGTPAGERLLSAWRPS